MGQGSLIEFRCALRETLRIISSREVCLPQAGELDETLWQPLYELLEQEGSIEEHVVANERLLCILEHLDHSGKTKLSLIMFLDLTLLICCQTVDVRYFVRPLLDMYSRS